MARRSSPNSRSQPLLDDLHVQKSQEAHAEAEAEGMRGLGLPHERRVVQRQLLQRLLQGLVLVAVDGKEAREHHGLRLAVAGKGLVHAAVGHGDRVAHLHLAHVLEARDQVAHLAHIECLLGTSWGCRAPTSSTSVSVPVAIMRILSPFLMRPSTTRMRATTPR